MKPSVRSFWAIFALSILGILAFFAWRENAVHQGSFDGQISPLPLSSLDNLDATGTTPALAPDENGLVTLALGERAEAGEIAIIPKRVITDSRCPKTVVCIWAGEVTVKLSLQDMGYPEIAPQIIEISTKDNGAGKIFAGYALRLTSVVPEKSEGTIDPVAYRLTFSLKRVSLDQVGSGVGTSSKSIIFQQGIIGKVLVGPMCPVVREGQACPDRPAVGVLLRITDIKTAIFHDVMTDDAGAFRYAASAGVYTITKGGGSIFPAIHPEQVTVPTAGTVTVVIHGDSGIR